MARLRRFTVPSILKSLQAGRAIAALSVLAFHVQSSPQLPSGSWLASKSGHGNMGVDFFFVLSGFIICHAHGKDIGQRDQLKRYVGNRFRRIYPIYWLYTAVFFAAFAVIGGVTVLPHTGAGWFSSLSLIRISPEHAPLSVAWTLFYEIAFYALFGLLILSRAIGTASFAVWAAAILAVHRYLPTHDPLGVWTSLLCANFFVGMAACWLHMRIGMKAALGMVGAGLAGLAVLAVIIDRSPLAEPLAALSFGLLICGAAAWETRNRLNFGPLVLIGDASYTLYLIHEPVSQVVLKVLAKVGLRVPADLTFVATIVLTTAACVAAYTLIERPLNAILRGSSKPFGSRLSRQNVGMTSRTIG